MSQMDAYQAGVQAERHSPGFVPTRRKVAFFEPAPMDLADSADLKSRVLDAGRRCLIRLGAERMSMHDVAEAANVSRKSVYKHFANRDALISAVLDLFVEMIARESAEAMAAHEALEDQLAAMAIPVIQWGMAERDAGIWNATEENIIVSRCAEPIFDRLIALAESYMAQAGEKGGVRRGADRTRAAEWLVRIAYSLVAFPNAQTFDADNLTELTAFFRAHAVRGLR